MAFQITTGIYTSVNDIIDALADAWEFESVDKTSSNHSVKWGISGFGTNSNGGIGILQNGAVSNTFVPAATGKYTIYKTSGAVACDVNGTGSLFVTAARSVDDPSDTDKLSAMQSTTNTAYIAGGTAAHSHNINNFLIVPTGTSAVQVVPYLHPNGGYAADNLYLARIAPSANENRRCYINEELYFICRGFAIKDGG